MTQHRDDLGTQSLLPSDDTETDAPAYPAESIIETKPDGENVGTRPRTDRGDTTDGGAVADERAPSLIETDSVGDFTSRWHDVQVMFVDEPREAVEQADQLVADVMRSVAAGFAGEKSRLESRWADGGEVATEDLRQALQRYRSFFERLLAA